LETGYLVSGSDDFSLKVWDIKQNKLIKSFDKNNQGHSDQIRRLIHLKDDYVASISLDKTIKIWNFTQINFVNNERALLIETIDSSKGGHTEAVLSSDKFEDVFNYLVTGSGDGTFKIWDVTNLRDIKLKRTFNAHNSMVASVVYLENGYIASASYDNTIKIWDINLGKLKYTFDQTNGGHDNPVDILVSLENGYLASCSSVLENSGVIKVWDITNGRLKYTFDKRNDGHNGYIFEMIPLKDGYLATASEDTTIKIWDITQGKIKYTFDSSNGGHKSIVWTLISLDDDLMGSGAGDFKGDLGELKIWNLNNGKLQQTFDKDNGGHKSRIYSFILFDNGDFASGSVDKTIKIWNKN
jgi:WD40 repeat protein